VYTKITLLSLKSLHSNNVDNVNVMLKSNSCICFGEFRPSNVPDSTGPYSEILNAPMPPMRGYARTGSNRLEIGGGGQLTTARSDSGRWIAKWRPRFTARSVKGRCKSAPETVRVGAAIFPGEWVDVRRSRSRASPVQIIALPLCRMQPTRSYRDAFAIQQGW